jgi:hypothetical protein
MLKGNRNVREPSGAPRPSGADRGWGGAASGPPAGPQRGPSPSGRRPKPPTLCGGRSPRPSSPAGARPRLWGRTLPDAERAAGSESRVQRDQAEAVPDATAVGRGGRAKPVRRELRRSPAKPGSRAGGARRARSDGDEAHPSAQPRRSPCVQHGGGVSRLSAVRPHPLSRASARDRAPMTGLDDSGESTQSSGAVIRPAH